MRWFKTLWWSLPIELSGPGDRPALTWARTRWLVQSRMDSSLWSRTSSWRVTGWGSRALPHDVDEAETPEPPMRSTPPEPEPDTI